MKNLTLYNKKNLIRFINKHTKDYVEIPCPTGQGTEVRRTLMEIAYSFAGWSGILGNQHTGDNTKPEFHYYALMPIAEDEINGICGIQFKIPQKSDNKMYITFEVDLKTNELIITDKIKKDLELLKIDDIYEYVNIENIM